MPIPLHTDLSVYNFYIVQTHVKITYTVHFGNSLITRLNQYRLIGFSYLNCSCPTDFKVFIDPIYLVYMSHTHCQPTTIQPFEIIGFFMSTTICKGIFIFLLPASRFVSYFTLTKDISACTSLSACGVDST